jgi:nicotinate dehydrogenase subunit B
MTRRAEAPRCRADFLAASGVLLVLREPPPAPPPSPGQPPLVVGNPAEGAEVLLAVWDDGSVTALHGHVDLGTGIRTALAQLVADELDVAFAAVHMVLGDTASAPNQGATIASASIQIHAAPLRAAAAQARAWLLSQAAGQLGVPAAQLQVDAGVVGVVGDAVDRARTLPYAALLAGSHTRLELALQTPLKPVADHRVIGRSVPRVDIPAKVAGDAVFVHDVRLPGMLHGRVVRPPYAGADHGDFIGNTLEAVDRASIAHVPGLRAIVVIRDFVGVVAEREEQAEQAMRELRLRWKPVPGLPSTADLEGALRANPATPRRLVDEGDVDAALAQAAQPMNRSYVWPYQLHASIGPSCAVAQWQGEARADAKSEGYGPRLTVWAGTQNPHVLRLDLARLTGLQDVAVEVIRLEAAGCYGRNGADDVAADAALLSRAVGAPVRVQLTREQENLWEPKGAAQLMEVRGGLNADGSVAGYDFSTSYPSNGAPTLALLLTRTIEPLAQAYAMGDRTARPPYDYAALRVTVNDMPPMLRASWLRGVSALPNSFAHESYVDELASAAGVDPVDFRLRLLKDERAAELVRATADRAGWLPHIQPQQQGASGHLLHGQGFAYARYVHSKWPGFGAAWAAWVADVDVDQRTGEVHVKRVIVGHDAGLMVNPEGVRHQIHGNVVQTSSRALKESVQSTAALGVLNRDWGSYPLLSFREVPVIEVLNMPRPGEPPLGAGESSSVPGTAAIANAIFDATGVRLRQPPFTPEVVRAALNPLPPPEGAGSAAAGAQPPAATPQTAARPLPADAPWPRYKPWARAGALLAGWAGLAAALLGLRTEIAPVARPDARIYTAATIERGRQLAALGDCSVCHTAPGGAAYAGGRAIATPFGSVYASNLTPDEATGLGRWSFSAFQRAMREGRSRDGHQLYPAFPYTAYARSSDDDLMALYAYLMSLPAVQAETPAPTLRFPFGLRPLMALWNALFHDASPYQPDTRQSAEWNRGAYLVEGLGHCGACHTPRQALGAERRGVQHLSGAVADGWTAPALTAASPSPVPWNAASLFDYLRHGVSSTHGSASGPMAEVVRELQAVPDADIHAMALYLASFQNADTAEVSDAQAQSQAQAEVARAQAAAARLLPDATARLFQGACAACHHDGEGPPLLGANVPLALSSKLHAATPDNLIRVILDGVQQPPTPAVGFMPALRDALDDSQIAALVGYMRARYAPARAPWTELPSRVREIRQR